LQFKHLLHQQAFESINNINITIHTKNQSFTHTQSDYTIILKMQNKVNNSKKIAKQTLIKQKNYAIKLSLAMILLQAYELNKQAMELEKTGIENIEKA